jgi:hypothetical protein
MARAADRDERRVRTYAQAARGGFISLAIFAVAFSVFWFLLPEQPKFDQHEPIHKAARGYEAGGVACHADQLARIASTEERQLRSDKCAEQSEVHSQQEDSIRQATRGAVAAEQAASMAYRQGVSAATAAGLLVLAFGASVWAAVAASRAAEAAHLSVAKADETLCHAQDTAKRQLRAYVSMVS